MKDSLKVVDVLRGVSILVVLAGHLQVLFVQQHSSIHLLEVAWFKFWLNHGFGVGIFFVVSGFLITRVLAAQPGGLFRPDLRDFYARRVGRIIPLLTLSCLLGLGVLASARGPSPSLTHCFGGWEKVADPRLWGGLWTFTFNWLKVLHARSSLNYGLHWDLLWSLSIEEQFYFFYPLILRWLGNRRALILFLLGMVLLGPLSILVGWRIIPHNNMVFYNSFAAFNLIAMGCLLFLAVERFGPFLAARKDWSRTACFSGVSIFLIFYLHYYVRGDDRWTLAANTFIGVGAFLFLLGGLHLGSFASKGWVLLSYPGRLSYGIYLLHPTLLYLLWASFPGKNQFIAYFLFILPVVTVAALSHRYFEKPVNHWIRSRLARVPGPKGA